MLDIPEYLRRTNQSTNNLENCPICGRWYGIKFPRYGNPYWEDCGWPDEDFEKEMNSRLNKILKEIRLEYPSYNYSEEFELILTQYLSKQISIEQAINLLKSIYSENK